MRVRSLFWLQMVLLVLVAGANQAALSFALYWRYLWFDMPVHFFGGAWVTVAFVWFFTYLGRSHGGILAALLVTLAVGVGWELFEYTFRISGGPGYMLDTSIDLLMDALGSVAMSVVLAIMSRHARTA